MQRQRYGVKDSEMPKSRNGRRVSRGTAEQRLTETFGPATPTDGSKIGVVQPPVRPRTKRLPLRSDELDFERFELFCHRLANHLPSATGQPYRFGGPGAKQHGIDIAVDTEGGLVTLQCRQVKTFGLSQFEKTTHETTFKADRHVIVLACTPSPAVRKALRRRRKWEVWDIDDVSTMVRQLPREVARRLVEDVFGTAVREAFLGGVGPSLYLLPEEFFEPFLDTSRLFNHTLELVGRESELGKLSEFVNAPESQLAVVVGKGGIGKTRLLKAFSDRLIDSTWNVRFVDGRMPITVEAVQELALEPTIVIVD